MKYIQVGRIINTHGLKGEVKVIALTDNPQRFDALKSVYLEARDTVEEETIKKSRNVNIESVKYVHDKLILKFKEINNVDDASLLKNLFIVIDMNNVVKLPEDSYFLFDIMGCSVYDTKNSLLGRIVDIIHTGSNDVYIVKSDNKEILIPALKSIVKSVEINIKKIIVELPEGL